MWTISLNNSTAGIGNPTNSLLTKMSQIFRELEQLDSVKVFQSVSVFRNRKSFLCFLNAIPVF